MNLRVFAFSSARVQPFSSISDLTSSADNKTISSCCSIGPEYNVLSQVVSVGR